MTKTPVIKSRQISEISAALMAKSRRALDRAPRARNARDSAELRVEARIWVEAANFIRLFTLYDEEEIDE